ncbi:hypothetical protein QBC38DRAFT_549794 [Podospora fimiseda]|uniref:Uncharacterized protein n=1 Tax=Podospora fimiseda TaxID=252190 RepID=A0AAN6YPV1_9PEZI|nr:hypothetical protein QBC38DRAFT_549794 [Podospora fimiseda]
MSPIVFSGYSDQTCLSDFERIHLSVGPISDRRPFASRSLLVRLGMGDCDLSELPLLPLYCHYVAHWLIANASFEAFQASPGLNVTAPAFAPSPDFHMAVTQQMGPRVATNYHGYQGPVTGPMIAATRLESPATGGMGVHGQAQSWISQFNTMQLNTPSQEPPSELWKMKGLPLLDPIITFYSTQTTMSWEEPAKETFMNEKSPNTHVCNRAWYEPWRAAVPVVKSEEEEEEEKGPGDAHGGNGEELTRAA